MKIAAIADIHITHQRPSAFADFFATVGNLADVLVLGGDLTDTGRLDEAQILADELARCRIPVVGVLGNHDHESDRQDEIAQMLNTDSCTILQGDMKVIEDVSFVGLKGFGGGFDGHMLSSWGEQAIKAFVHEAVEDALRLDSVLARVTTDKKVVIMHYSPIRSTVEGEPPEIFPFLGSSRLSEPLNRRGADVVFHGHAHKGAFEGKTTQGIPVYNVTMHNIKQKFPKQSCFVFEV